MEVKRTLTGRATLKLRLEVAPADTILLHKTELLKIIPQCQ
ncbi:hypothetical protein PROFUN_04416 [Planoprotostelium fungivorum]|uniref:Uncharacterized protein n=1 Tax=Planoprotostelium fungivorum TaxID=1890364 RepID=A0A2P6NHY1_9EUKA|nr:hypothetical protein PROFUN_04416 [Planoprotostelium fungivorum]